MTQGRGESDADLAAAGGQAKGSGAAFISQVEQPGLLTDGQ